MGSKLEGQIEEEFGGNLQQLVAQAIFSVLDHIACWLRLKFSALMAENRKEESKLTPDEIRSTLARSKEYTRLKLFQERLPHEGLANVSYLTGAFHRSAFHLDQYLRQESGVRAMTPTELCSLQRLYSALEEPDLVLGVAA